MASMKELAELRDVFSRLSERVDALERDTVRKDEYRCSLDRVKEGLEQRLDALEKDSASQGFVDALCQQVTDLYLKLDKAESSKFSEYFRQIGNDIWKLGDRAKHLEAKFQNHCAKECDSIFDRLAEERERTTVEEFEKAKAEQVIQQIEELIEESKERSHEIVEIANRLVRSHSDCDTDNTAGKLYDKGIRAEDLE